MAKKEILIEGKQKTVYETENPGIVLIRFNDIVTAFDGIKRAVIKGKGVCNNFISSMAFQTLTAAGIPNHFIEKLNDREQLCKKVDYIPLQVVVRNRLAGTTAQFLGLESGTKTPNTVYEFRYHNTELNDPMINEHHAVALGLVTYEEASYVMDLAKKVNDILKEMYHKAGIELIDFKMEIGKDSDGNIILCDEISPDNSRLWDEKTGEILDKDRFRRDMSDVCASYREVKERLEKTL